MTPQETRLLEDFLTQMVQAGRVPKDGEAEALIQRAAHAQPDALYLVVQRSLIQQQALEAAQKRIGELERAGDTGRREPAGSFLGGGGWGRSSAVQRSEPGGQSLAGEAAAFRARQGAAAAAPSGGPQRAMAPTGASGSRGPGMLGQIAATAAGVAGGAFLFHGIGSLLGQGSGEGSDFLNPGGLSPVSESGTAGESGSEGADAGAPDQVADAGSYDADPGSDGGDTGDAGGGDFAGGDFGGGDFAGGDFGSDDFG